MVGRVIIELGYAETYALRSCRGQDQGDLSDLPAQDGSTLYKLLTDPDNVNLENLSLDIFGVRFKISLRFFVRYFVNKWRKENVEK